MTTENSGKWFIPRISLLISAYRNAGFNRLTRYLKLSYVLLLTFFSINQSIAWAYRVEKWKLRIFMADANLTRAYWKLHLVSLQNYYFTRNVKCTQDQISDWKTRLCSVSGYVSWLYVFLDCLSSSSSEEALQESNNSSSSDSIISTKKTPKQHNSIHSYSKLACLKKIRKFGKNPQRQSIIKN